MTDNQRPHVYLIAGELSGDLLGGRLMSSLTNLASGKIDYSGVGGPDMSAEGLSSLFPMSDLSVMGIAEVLPQIPKLLRRISTVVKDIKRQKPSVVVTIDAPDFCFRVAKRLKGSGIPVVHLVAPTVWAWRPGRAAKVAQFLDHMMCLFPFEPPYFEKEGLPSTFVGHSVIESGAITANGAAFREQHRIAADVPLLAVLPGSRVGEVNRHLPVFRETVAQLREVVPDLQLVSVTTGPVAEIVINELVSWPVPSIVSEVSTDKYNAMAAANVALAASGTVALELGVVGTPAVIAYRVSPVTAWIGKRLVTAKYASLINILMDEEIMPERLIDQCRPEILCDELSHLFRHPDKQSTQTNKFAMAVPMLSVGLDQSPSQKAAETVMNVIKMGKQT